MTVYPERRNQNLTGVWIAEAKVHGERVRARFGSQKDGDQWMDRIQFPRFEHTDAGAERPLQQKVYPERRNGRLTNRWIAEVTLCGKPVRPRFDTLETAERWLAGIKLISAHKPQCEAKQMDTLPVTRIPLPEDGKRVIRHLQSASEPFRSMRPPMLFEHVWTFLMVAVDEGRSVGEYAERGGVSNSVMSRYLLDLGGRNSSKGKGYGLIEQRPKPLELRKHEVYLTAEGRALAEHLIRNHQQT